MEVQKPERHASKRRPEIGNYNFTAINQSITITTTKIAVTMARILKSSRSLLSSTVLLLVLCNLQLSSGSVNTASAASSGFATLPTTSPSSPVVSSATAVVSSEGGARRSNFVGQIAGYVKTSVTRTVDGCGQLWSNYGTCKEIRAKIKTHQSSLKEQWVAEGVYQDNAKEMRQMLQKSVGGISFAEYAFLQKGKLDRGKVMNLAFLVFGAPRFLPYALMFQPDMLPAPLKPPLDESTGETFFQKQSRERSTSIIQMLLNLEKDARVIPAAAKLNIFGRKKQEGRMKSMQALNRQLAGFLATTGTQSRDGARHLINQLEPLLYSKEEIPRAVSRLIEVPVTFTKGLGNALLGDSILSNLSPAFMIRGRLIGHIRKIAEADTFLVDAGVDVASINPILLRETCSDRLIGSSGTPVTELRASLRDWLDLVEKDPSELQRDGAVHYNSNLARTALMGYYSLQATQDEGCASVLPRVLYSGKATTQATDEDLVEARAGRFRFR